MYHILKQLKPLVREIFRKFIRRGDSPTILSVDVSTTTMLKNEWVQGQEILSRIMSFFAHSICM